MTGTAPLALIQTDPAVLTLLERIAWSQMIMAAVTVLVGIAIIGATIYSVRLLRAAERSVKQLVPRVEPIIEKANGIAANAGDLSDSVRETGDEVLGTVRGLNERLRDAAEVTEQRVRDFGAVLEVVREEAESILLDSAATARGVHTAAERLRQPRTARTLGAAAPAPPAVRSLLDERVPARKHPEE
ncbi:MAG: hypothetical protein ACRELX_04255 [Longimicrobiales bacterium]